MMNLWNGKQIEAGLQNILLIFESLRRHSNVHLSDNIENKKSISKDEKILKSMNINLNQLKMKKKN